MLIYKKLKIAIIGCGNIAFFNDMGDRKQTLTYVSAVKKLSKNFKLISIAEKNSEKLKILKKKIKNIIFYRDYLEMLTNEDIDVCVVATENKYHYKILKEISNFDIKAVITEKPFILDIASGKKIIKIYKEKKILLSVNYSRRFVKKFEIIKSLLKKKNINEILIISTRGIINNGCHYIDILIWYYGKIKNIEILFLIKSKIIKNDYAGLVKITLANNIKAYLLVLDLNNIFIEELLFTGKKCKIHINSKKRIFVENNYKKNYNSIDYSSALPNHLKYIRNNLIKSRINKFSNSLNDAIYINKIIKKINKRSKKILF